MGRSVHYENTDHLPIFVNLNCLNPFNVFVLLNLEYPTKKMIRNLLEILVHIMWGEILIEPDVNKTCDLFYDTCEKFYNE